MMLKMMLAAHPAHPPALTISCRLLTIVWRRFYHRTATRPARASMSPQELTLDGSSPLRKHGVVVHENKPGALAPSRTGQHSASSPPPLPQGGWHPSAMSQSELAIGRLPVAQTIMSVQAQPLALCLQPQNKCQSKPAVSPRNPVKTNNRRTKQPTIFRDTSRPHFLISTRQCLPSRIRCNSLKTNDRRLAYSTIFRGSSDTNFRISNLKFRISALPGS